MSTTARPAVLRRPLAWVAFVALTLAGCSGDDDDTAPSTTVAPTTTTIAPRVNDGRLKVGVFLPLTGPGAALGPPMIEALSQAEDVINDAGGALGADIELVQLDEGAGTIEELMARGVDAIIGPASSTLALSALRPAVNVNSGVVTCSPMATGLALDDYPDNDFFFRTAPSDSLQMVTLARMAERTGSQTVAVGYLDDPYGRGLEEAFVDAIGDRLPVATVGFSGDQDDLSATAAEMLDGDPGVVVVLGDADDASRLLTALDEASDDPPQILINDSLRQARPVIQNLSETFRERLTGIAPQSGAVVEDGPQGFFVPHAVDCLNLITLAAIFADSDDPTVFRRAVSSVSSGGRSCGSFESCAALVEQEFEIDYNGYSGRVDLSGVTGDPVRAWFETFTFDEGGNEIPGEPTETLT